MLFARVTAEHGLEYELASLNKSYPLTARKKSEISSNNSDADSSSPDSNNSEEKSESSSIGDSGDDRDSGDDNDGSSENNNEDKYNHVQAYLRYVKRGGKLGDGVENLLEDTITVQPPRKNAVPWFARVIAVQNADDIIAVRWLHRQDMSTKFFFLEDKIDEVHFEAIICNGIEMKPVWEGAQVMWKLLTFLVFIQGLNSDDLATIDQTRCNTAVRSSVPRVDITELVFEDAEEFRNFIVNIE